MRNCNSFRRNTQDYLKKYHCILHTMIYRMSHAPFRSSISGNFIVQMLPHHQAAIEMSQNLLAYTINIPLQTIALNIIVSQSKSIENMLKALDTCQEVSNSSQQLHTYRMENARILQTMFSEMSSACADNCIDADFIREMLPHHKGAIHMSMHALRYPLCPELVPILHSILHSQEKGVHEMQCLLSQISP